MQPTFPASKPLSRVFMQAIDAPLPDDAQEAAAGAAVPVADPPAPAVQPTGQNACKPGLAPKALQANYVTCAIWQPTMYHVLHSCITALSSPQSVLTAWSDVCSIWLKLGAVACRACDVWLVRAEEGVQDAAGPGPQPRRRLKVRRNR